MNTISLIIVVVGSGVFALALARSAPKAVPLAGVAAQGVLGVYTGMMVRSISFVALGSHWPIVVAVAVGTLVISIAGGVVLGLHRDVSPLTGALALVAGGSSGLVAIARELGGDDRVVAAVQYLRVALIMMSMPVVATVIYHGTNSHGPQISEASSFPWYVSVPVIAVIVVAGAAAGRSVRLPGSGLIGPMAITIVLELSGLADRLTVPMMLVQAGIMLIGWQAGLSLTRESLQAIKRILPGALALIGVLSIASAGFGVVLAKVAGLSQLDGYLATSPGGIYAVLATAAGTGSNVPFIMAAQIIRIVMMLFAAPFIGRFFLRFTPESATTSSAGSEPIRSDTPELVLR